MSNRPSADAHIEKLVNDALAVLMEYCDAVRIFASVYENKLTHRITKGAGNYYAQVGMCREFLNRDQAQSEDEVFKENEE